MTKPAISVVCCTYNRPKMLERAVSSVLAQTFADWELVIVNDGREPLNLGISDPRIKFVALGHQGQPMAHNLGLVETTADLITFLDDDDTYEPFNLGSKVEEMKSGEDMVYFPSLVTPNNTLCGDHAWTEENLLKGLCVPNLSLVLRRSVFDRFGYHDERCPVYWDWDWQLRAFYKGLQARLVSNSAPVGLYNIHEQSVVRLRTNQAFHDAIRERATGKRTNELTLVVASYNYPQYLPRLVEGMYNQTCPNWRLIIVDDASPNEELQGMLRDLKGSQEHITIKINRKNKGTCATLAQGFKMVNTAYSAALDADNFLLPDYVVRMIDHLDTNPTHVGAHCAFAQYVDMVPTGVVIQKAPITYENSIGQPPGTTLATWRTEIVKDILPRHELCPDWDMMMRGVEQGPVGYIEEPLVGWEDHKTSRWWWNQQESEASTDACRRDALERRGK